MKINWKKLKKFFCFSKGKALLGVGIGVFLGLFWLFKAFLYGLAGVSCVPLSLDPALFYLFAPIIAGLFIYAEGALPSFCVSFRGLFYLFLFNIPYYYFLACILYFVGGQLKRGLVFLGERVEGRVKAFISSVCENKYLKRVLKTWGWMVKRPSFLLLYKLFKGLIRVIWRVCWAFIKFFLVVLSRIFDTFLKVPGGRIEELCNINTRSGVKVQSHGEERIADYLYDCGLDFDYDKPFYFDGILMRPDFYLPDRKVFIEYWGMKGDPKYEERKKKKLSLYRQTGANLISVYPKDISRLHSMLRM